MNPTTDITCPRCRAEALGMPVDTALEELQLAASGGHTNRWHSPGCAMVPTEYHEAVHQLRAMSIGGPVSWILSTLPVRMVGLDAYVVVGEAGDQMSLATHGDRLERPSCRACGSVTEFGGSHELICPEARRTERPTLTLDRVVVCAMAELKARTPGAYRELDNTEELDRIVADLEQQRRQLAAVDDGWPGIDDRPAPDRYPNDVVPLDHWSRKVLRWLKANEPAAIAELPIPEDAMLRACRALGFIATENEKPRCVEGYEVTYTTTRACLANSIHKDAEVCHDCAARLPASATKQHAFWEGPDHECDACGATIESAYGDPDAEARPTASLGVDALAELDELQRGGT